MKNQHLLFLTAAIIAAFVISSCTAPITLTSWKNQEDNSKISKVVVMALFGKLEYTKPVEQYVAACFNRQGLKSIEALDFLNPTKKYEEAEPLLERILDIDEQLAGVNSPVLITDLNNLAAVYANQKKFGDSEALYARAAHICQNFNDDPRKLITVLDNMANMYEMNNDSGKADSLRRQSESITSKIVSLK